MSNINSIVKEFKAFILKGNVINMTIGVIIDGALSKTVTSLVNDILMPLLSALTNDTSFNTLKCVIHPAATVNRIEVAGAAIPYDNFLQNILDFLIIGVCMFFMTKTAVIINSRLHHEEETKEEAPALAGPTQKELLTEIRDLLKERGDIT